jgi:hypothetical protein
MKMVTVIFYETGSTNATTQRHIPEDRACHQLSSYGNLSSREFTVIARKEMVL